MNTEDTQPPRQPNTPRTYLKKLWEWLKANPIYAAAIGGFLAGLILPKIVAML